MQCQLCYADRLQLIAICCYRRRVSTAHLTRHIFSCFTAHISMSHVTLAQVSCAHVIHVSSAWFCCLDTLRLSNHEFLDDFLQPFCSIEKANTMSKRIEERKTGEERAAAKPRSTCLISRHWLNVKQLSSSGSASSNVPRIRSWFQILFWGARDVQRARPCTWRPVLSCAFGTHDGQCGHRWRRFAHCAHPRRSCSASRHPPFSCRDPTEYEMKNTIEQGTSLTAAAEREFARDVKEKVCYIASSCDTVFTSTREKRQGGNLRFSEGNTITVGAVRVFQPSLTALLVNRTPSHVIFSRICPHSW